MRLPCNHARGRAFVSPRTFPCPILLRVPQPHAMQLRAQLSSASSPPPMLASWLATAEQQKKSSSQPLGAAVQVHGLSFHPPGADQPLLQNINMELPANSFNLVIGRSGSGKTTLLQLLAGLCEQTAGAITFSQPEQQMQQLQPASGSTVEDRMKRVGLVFQFPERHFLGDTIANEISFAWPQSAEQRWALSNRTHAVLSAVGLSAMPLHLPPSALSGGQQRRLALAVQLIRGPSLLLLDEPLAGLDWQSRAEVTALLAALKKECTLLVVSHDLLEVAPLVDYAWEMKLGGSLSRAGWPA